jgi:hypothetical protein
MSIENENRHIHTGKSSQAILNPEKIIDAIGIRIGDNILDDGCGNGFEHLKTYSPGPYHYGPSFVKVSQ